MSNTLLLVFWILKEANAMLITKDFDGDGLSERIAVSVAAVSIITSPASNKDILGGKNYRSPEEFLKQFSR